MQYTPWNVGAKCTLDNELTPPGRAGIGNARSPSSSSVQYTPWNVGAKCTLDEELTRLGGG